MSYGKKQIKVGLTGGIGSGKTFVSTILSKLCIPVFNSDIEAKKCMNRDEVLKRNIINIFGNETYSNGMLQKEVLADIIFNDKQNLEEINKLVHPAVRQSFDDWCKNQTSNILVKESAILFESNFHIGLNKVICVSAEEETRIKRVIKRDNTSREEVVSRIASQISQTEKERLSDFVIVNNLNELIIPQVIQIISQIS